MRYLREDAKTKQLVYRRRTPEELLPFAGRTQVRKFLGSSNPNDPGGRRKLTEAQQEFDEVVRSTRLAAERSARVEVGDFDDLDPQAITALARVYHIEVLEDDDEGRWDDSERKLHAAVAASLAGVGGALDQFKGRERTRWAAKARESAEAVLAGYQAYEYCRRHGRHI